MNAKKIKQALRKETSSALERKRKIVLLSAIGLVDFSLISLYQTGVIRKLPDLPGKIFDSNQVNASPKAYALGMPDGPLSAVVFAATMALATAGGSEKSGRHPIFDVLMGGAVLGNAAGAAEYLVDMIVNQKKACLYCLLGAGLSFASLKLAAPEAIRGAKKWWKRR